MATLFYRVNSGEGLLPIREFYYNDHFEYLKLYTCVNNDVHFGLYVNYKALDGVSVSGIDKIYNPNGVLVEENPYTYPSNNAIHIKQAQNQTIEKFAGVFTFPNEDLCIEYLRGINEFDNYEDANAWALKFAKRYAENYNDVVGTNIHFDIYIDGVIRPTITITGGLYDEDSEVQPTTSNTYRYGSADFVNDYAGNPMNTSFNALAEDISKENIGFNYPAFLEAMTAQVVNNDILRPLFAPFLPTGLDYYGLGIKFYADFDTERQLFTSKPVSIVIPYNTKGMSETDVYCYVQQDATIPGRVHLTTTTVDVHFSAYDPQQDEFNNNDTSTLDNTLDTSDSVVPQGLANALTRTYLMTQQRLQQLGQNLWSLNFFDNIELLNQNPLENIINCNICRVGDISGTQKEITIGNVEMGVYGDEVGTTLCTINVGTFKIPHYYKSFLDFAPYTNITIYLPYVGHRELDPNIFMDRTASVNAVIDVVSGTITYKIYVSNLLVYEFNGMCAVNIPVAGRNNSQVLASYINGGLQIAGNVASENYLGAAMSAINTAATQYHSSTNGNMSPSNILAECTKCFVVVDRPSVTYPSAYGHTQGRPCNLTLPLSTLSGYTELINPDITGLHCPDAVMRDLIEKLESGFYL